MPDPGPLDRPARNAPAPGPGRRDPWLHGILAVVTLGMSAYHWCYVTIRDAREHRGETHRAGLLTGLSIGFLAGGLVLMLLLFLPLLLVGLGAATGFGFGRDPADVVRDLFAAGAAAVVLTVLGMLVAVTLLAAGAVLRYVLLYQAADAVGDLGTDAGHPPPVPAVVYPLAAVVAPLTGVPFLGPLAWGGSMLHLQTAWNRSLEAPLPARPEAAGT